MSDRLGEMKEMKEIGDRMRFVYHAPSRGLLGFRNDMTNKTRGTATINSTFSHYDKVNMANFSKLNKGKLVSMETGSTTGYSLMNIEQRGNLFIGANEEVYEKRR